MSVEQLIKKQDINSNLVISTTSKIVRKIVVSFSVSRSSTKTQFLSAIKKAFRFKIYLSVKLNIQWG